MQAPASRGAWVEVALHLDRWMEARQYAGPDPYDLLASRHVRRLTLGSRWLAVAWTQLGRRSPVDVRRLLGVPATCSAKGLGLVLAARVRLGRALEESGRVGQRPWGGAGGERVPGRGGSETGLELGAQPVVAPGEESSPEQALDGEPGLARAPGGRGVGERDAGPGPGGEVLAEVRRLREGARALVERLGALAVPHGDGAGWGYPFPWANRGFYVPAGTPTSVVTAFVGHGLLDAAEELGVAGAAALAERAGRFLRTGLRRIGAGDGSFCFSYTPVDRRVVHNANLLAASLLARLAARSGDGAAAQEVLGAARFSVRAQRRDGSWPYGEAARDRWVDSFHTSYSLVALHEIGQRLGTAEFDEALERGIAYWRRAFLCGPAVGLWPGRAYPVDAHGVAHAILTLLILRERIAGALGEARRLGAWALEEMRDGAGFFYYRRYRFFANRIPYMRWTQAWMLRALAELALVGEGAEEGGQRGGNASASTCFTTPAPRG